MLKNVIKYLVRLALCAFLTGIATILVFALSAGVGLLASPFIMGLIVGCFVAVAAQMAKSAFYKLYGVVAGIVAAGAWFVLAIVAMGSEHIFWLILVITLPVFLFFVSIFILAPLAKDEE